MKVEDVPEKYQSAVVAAYIALGTAPGGPDEVDIPSHNDVAFILAAVIPAIQNAALERAAVVVETSLYIMSGSQPSHLQHDPKRAKNDNHHATIAAAIRALMEET
jgi:hypothetical protein